MRQGMPNRNKANATAIRNANTAALCAGVFLTASRKNRSKTGVAAASVDSHAFMKGS